jgi:hypothetical protein
MLGVRVSGRVERHFIVIVDVRGKVILRDLPCGLSNCTRFPRRLVRL